jgi:hypothetical protein
MPIEKQTRYKVMIRTFINGPWSSVVERPVTRVSWDEKSGKSFWLAKLEYQLTNEKPLYFSKAAAESIVSQIDRWKFDGPGPTGKATARIVPIINASEVK